MTDNYRRAERALLEEIADVILGLYDQSFPYDLEYKWDEYVTALASRTPGNTASKSPKPPRNRKESTRDRDRARPQH